MEGHIRPAELGEHPMAVDKAIRDSESHFSGHEKACKLEAVRKLKEKIEELFNNAPCPQLILSGDFNMNLLGTELSEEAVMALNTFWQIHD
ncbi:hypothetical protein NDU88_001045 [Pleurodeles waltl]|uniref:Uncharacterized protein n=1 Tax=Pleurodeles waltl TaxID=8319 RepID=A0AAV7VYA3_PLEWA|nr:hypothetical protein NDU88_001045 [Pleurodeles waltl]